MENVNPNGNNVATINLDNTNIFSGKIVKIELKNKHHILFF
jgi:hypothetical protein